MTPTLFKRCDCTARCDHPYWYEFELHGHRFRKSTRTTNKNSAAEIADAARKSATKQAAGIVSIEPAPRLNDFVADYAEWAKQDHPASADAVDARVLATFVAFIGMHKPIDTITTFDIERWRSARAKKVSRTTVNRESNVIRGLFSKAVEWKKLQATPLKAVKRYRVDDPFTRVLSPEELQILLTQAPADHALICRVTLECLPRLNEVLSLHKTDIGPNWIQIRRKGGRVDRIPVSPELRTALLDRLGTRPGYVFGEPPPARGPMSAAFTRTFRKLGIKGVSHHTMRHTGVTLMLEAGINPRVIQKFAGWTSMRMLERYGHTRDREAIHAVTHNAAIIAAAMRSPQEPPHEGVELPASSDVPVAPTSSGIVG